MPLDMIRIQELGPKPGLRWKLTRGAGTVMSRAGRVLPVPFLRPWLRSRGYQLQRSGMMRTKTVEVKLTDWSEGQAVYSVLNIAPTHGWRRLWAIVTLLIRVRWWRLQEWLGDREWW